MGMAMAIARSCDDGDGLIVVATWRPEGHVATVMESMSFPPAYQR